MLQPFAFQEAGKGRLPSSALSGCRLCGLVRATSFIFFASLNRNVPRFVLLETSARCATVQIGFGPTQDPDGEFRTKDPDRDGLGIRPQLESQLWERWYFMLKWAVIFLIIALVAGVLGFTGIAGTAAGIAQFLFVLFLVVFAIMLIMGLAAGRKITK